MTTSTDFDRLVASWLDTEGPSDVRQSVVDAAIVSTGHVAQRRGLRAVALGPGAWPVHHRLPATARRRWLIAAAMGLLLLGLLMALYAGASLLRSNHWPALYVTKSSAFDCVSIGRLDTSSGQEEPVVDCLNRPLLSPDGIHAVAQGATGLQLVDLRTGTRSVVPGTEGTEPVPLEWSPHGMYLYWVDSSAHAPGVRGYIGSLSEPTLVELPEPNDGSFWGGVTWSDHENRAVYEAGSDEPRTSGDGKPLSNGAPSELRVSAVNGALALSPDGSLLALSGFSEVADTTDVLIDDGAGTPTNLTNFPDGTRALGAAWSPDGSTLAVVSETVTDQLSSDFVLWVYRRDGSHEHSSLVLDEGPIAGFEGIDWAPDGRHIRIGLSYGEDPSSQHGVAILDAGDRAISLVHSLFPWTAVSPDGAWLVAQPFPGSGQNALDLIGLDGSSSRSFTDLDYGYPVSWAR